MQLKIRQTGMNSHGLKVWLEGVELLHLFSLTLECQLHQGTVATLRIAVDGLDVDTQTAAHLIAFIRERAAEADR